MFYGFARVIRHIAMWLDFMLLTLLLYVWAWLPQLLRGRAYFYVFRVWCRAFARALNVNLKLHQKNLYPIPGQYILIANHPSAFEDIGIPALFDAYSLAKLEVRDWWLVGRISAAAGTLYVKREDRDSRKQASQTMIDELKAGKNIALYPEGGCKGRRVFESFRFGAFDISLQTGIPILPVFLHYESQDDFEWRSPQTLLHKLWHFMTTQNNTANYYVFDVIDPKKFSSKEEFTEYTWKLYKQWQQKYLE